MIRNKYHCAFFDVDGTLVDSTKAHGMAWYEAFKKFGFEVPFELIKEDIGMGGMEIIIKHLGKEQAEKSGRQIADLQLSILQNKFINKVVPFSYASKLIYHLSNRGVNVILASSAPREVVEKFIDLLNIREAIVNYVTGSDVKHSKPSPDIFIEALKNCCPDKKGKVVIGDSPYDIEGACRAGLPTIAILNNGFDINKLRKARYIFKDLKELYKNVDKLFSGERDSCQLKK